MSHFIDIVNLKGKVFMLNSLALSGESFSTKYCIGVEHHQEYYTDKDYCQITKSIVSDCSIELSVKLRNYAELMREKGISYDNKKMIICSNSGMQADRGSKSHDFLYICNKIIHAKEFRLDMVSSRKYEAAFEWWDGELTLSGSKHGGKKWEFFFSITSWCESVMKFINSCESSLNLINKQSEDREIYR